MSAETDGRWVDVDDWWGEYVTTRQADLRRLRDLIEQSDTRWADDDSAFERDPLRQNWEAHTPMAGPLRTTQEENWSQWLAHLVRSSDGTFTTTLFDCPVETPARSVMTEQHVASDRYHDRRVDIVVQLPDRACSIEVKRGDPNYEKTTQAAYLAERNATHDKPWEHYLLVPASRRDAVADTFGSRYHSSDGGADQIQSSEFVDVDVLWWRDVARALRDAIGIETDRVWQASAFLFVILIEQKVANFRSLPAIRADLAGKSVPAISGRDVDAVDAQIEYLGAQLEGVR